MSSYRITEFTSLDMAKTIAFSKTLRAEIASAGAESIDIVSVGDGKGLVVTKYASQAILEAATDVHKQAFGKMVAAGLVDAASISAQSGEVVISF